MICVPRADSQDTEAQGLISEARDQLRPVEKAMSLEKVPSPDGNKLETKRRGRGGGNNGTSYNHGLTSERKRPSGQY